MQGSVRYSLLCSVPRPSVCHRRSRPRIVPVATTAFAAAAEFSEQDAASRRSSYDPPKPLPAPPAHATLLSVIPYLLTLVTAEPLLWPRLAAAFAAMVVAKGCGAIPA